MLKQSPSRNLRASAGRYKVKHVSQICLVLAVSLWMLYQLRHCYFNKASTNEGTGLSHNVAAATLGRKGLLPGLVEEEGDDEEAKGTDEAGRGDEFEQVDDLMEEEADEQEAEIGDKDQENQN